MNKLVIVAFLLTASAMVRAQQTAPPAQPLTVAVLPFGASDDRLLGAAAELPALVSAKLSARTDLWIVEREELDKLLSEQTLKLSGLTDPANAVQVGKITGAKVLVSGRVIRNGKGSIVVAKIMSAETSRVFGETASFNDPGSLEPPAAELAEKIGNLVSVQRQALSPAQQSRADRIAALKASLGGKPLPPVKIRISEQDLSRTVIDPAVETEFGKIILELGGRVLEADKSDAAEVLITGEAISQLGARRGQIVSARARVEIKAVRASDGKVLAIDRQTSVAADIAEAVAGKSALQEAALELAGRVLPRLVDL